MKEKGLMPVFRCPKCGVHNLRLWDKDGNYPDNLEDIGRMSCINCCYEQKNILYIKRT